MQSVLVDTSVWIDYFSNGSNASTLEPLIDDNLVVTNNLILAELLPYLKIRRQNRIVSLLEAINCAPLEINWRGIIDMQFKCLRSGANGVGIPDLVIAQNAKTHGCAVYSLDKHFRLIKLVYPGLELFA
jgi:predicted nucleic acid-binding protein